MIAHIAVSLALVAIVKATTECTWKDVKPDLPSKSLSGKSSIDVEDGQIVVALGLNLYCGSDSTLQKKKEESSAAIQAVVQTGPNVFFTSGGAAFKTSDCVNAVAYQSSVTTITRIAAYDNNDIIMVNSGDKVNVGAATQVDLSGFNPGAVALSGTSTILMVGKEGSAFKTMKLTKDGSNWRKETAKAGTHGGSLAVVGKDAFAGDATVKGISKSTNDFGTSAAIDDDKVKALNFAYIGGYDKWIYAVTSTGALFVSTNAGAKDSWSAVEQKMKTTDKTAFVLDSVAVDEKKKAVYGLVKGTDNKFTLKKAECKVKPSAAFGKSVAGPFVLVVAALFGALL